MARASRVLSVLKPDGVSEGFCCHLSRSCSRSSRAFVIRGANSRYRVVTCR
jgi:hypothetical protein